MGRSKGENLIEADLRFVLSMVRMLYVPNLILYNDCIGRWYDYVLALQIVSVSDGGESKQGLRYG